MCTILVVDDHEDIREGLREELSLLNHEVLTASNGLEALQYLEDETIPRVCLIVLDLRMPFMDGWDLLYELRNQQGWRNLPVIVLSATVVPGAAPPVLRAQAFWSKPPSSEQIESIQRYCEQHRESVPGDLP
jgi:CheY-like chemotaxis protein